MYIAYCKGKYNHKYQQRIYLIIILVVFFFTYDLGRRKNQKANVTQATFASVDSNDYHINGPSPHTRWPYVHMQAQDPSLRYGAPHVSCKEQHVVCTRFVVKVRKK